MKQILRPLSNAYFILSLIILLTNDFFLKYEYHNWITGKLSDVTGLFVFVYFWTVIFPRLKVVVYWLTALIFMYWKSTCSQPLIDFFTEYIYPIDRVVDPSDLLALLVLPIAYFIRQEQHLKLQPIPIAILTIFSFCATSLPRPTQTFEHPEYVLFRPANLQANSKYYDNFQYYDDFIAFNVDSMEVIGVRRIEIEKTPVLRDSYSRSKILADLDLRVLCYSKGKYTGDSTLNSYRSLRDSLTIAGPTSITLDLDSVVDELNFLGTRLHGPFKRYAADKHLLIDGRYRKGIQDSIWNFYDQDKKITTRKYFMAGELTMIERFHNDKLISTTSVNTRKDAIVKQYIIVVLISVVLILIATRLFLNFRASGNTTFVRISPFAKVVQVLLLPTIIFTASKVISGLISDVPGDVFISFFQLFLTNIVLIPVLSIVYSVLKLKSRFDLGWYLLLFTFTLVWFEQFLYLRQIVE